jgi:hypothetical protein
MIQQMEKDVFYSTLCNLLLVYVSDHSRNSAMVSHHSDMITGVMRIKDRDMVAAGQPGDRLYKQTVFIAALECVPAFFCLFDDS